MSMNIVVIAVGAGLVAVLAKWMAWPRTRAGRVDMGFVSHQWVAEHRLSQISHPPR